MTKFKKYLKRTLLTLLALTLILVAFGFWFVSLLDHSVDRQELLNTTPNQLGYLDNSVTISRGKILAVVTSVDKMGTSGKSTGYEHTELARAYYVFQANGFEVEIASPKGGEPPVVFDDDDMGRYDYAFVNDKDAMTKVKNTKSIASVRADDYQAIYFVGGKGAMFDFPSNHHIQSLVVNLYNSNKVIGAVCHGPAALVDVKLANGSPLIEGKLVSGFTNEEELFLIPDAKTIFPFLLQDKLTNQGANFVPGPAYLETIAQDENLITGQNPWSVWKLAESMVRQLGFTPIQREITAEERTIELLKVYQTQGYDGAKHWLVNMLVNQHSKIDRNLLAMHSIVAIMQYDIGKTADILRLLSQAKSLSQHWLSEQANQGQSS